MRKPKIFKNLVGFCIVIVLLICMGQIMHVNRVVEPDNIFNSINLRQSAFSDGWVDAQTGVPIKYDRWQKALAIPASPNETVQIEKIVSQPVASDEYLIFRAYSEQVEVLLNGETVYSYSHYQEPMVPPAMYRMFRVLLPELNAGDRITLSVCNDQRNTAYIQYLSCGDNNSAFLLLFSDGHSALATAMIAMIVAILSILVFIHYLILKKPHYELLYLALFSVLAMTWIILDSGVGAMFTQHNLVQYYLRHISYMLMPAAYLMFLQGVIGDDRDQLRIVSMVFVGIAFTATLMNQWNVLPLADTIPVFNILLLITGVYASIYTVHLHKKGEWTYSIFTIIFFSSVSVSILLYYTRGLLQGSLLFRYALALVAIAMLVNLMRSINYIENEADRAEQYRKHQEQTESRMMLTQINSHFFNNTMNTIRGLIKFDPDAAYKMTSDFSKYLRFRINAAGDDGATSTFWEELKAIRAYADICIVRYDNKLKVVYDIDNTDFRIPTLTIEPFVENAIRHGIFEGTGEGTVTITAKQSESGGYTVTVSDDGRGFNVNELEKTDAVGVRNVTKRMMQYAGCSVKINSTIGEGTTVILQYPESL